MPTEDIDEIVNRIVKKIGWRFVLSFFCSGILTTAIITWDVSSYKNRIENSISDVRQTCQTENLIQDSEIKKNSRDIEQLQKFIFPGLNGFKIAQK